MTFGNGLKGKVFDKRMLEVEGLPRLKNVLLVEGSKANLISISQLCDQGRHVRFYKDECQVFDKAESCVMEGLRSLNNCYMLALPLNCHKHIVDETEIWHQKLGHLNYKTLRKIINIGVVRRVPKVGKKPLEVCGPCQIEKHKKVLHKVMQQISTTRALELLHMDLMGPMQVESIGGK